MALIAQSMIFFASRPCWIRFTCLLLAIYFFPLVCFRILTCLSPIREGVSNILEKKFSPWWAGHQIQALFIATPWLESLLRLTPGCYSLWLRAWGSKIGKNVYWTPGVTNYDRNLLEVGDHVTFGERAVTVCHVITPKEGKGLLKIAKVRVQSKSFVGAGSVLSPGVVVEEGTLVKAGSQVYPGQRVTKEGIV